MDQGAQVNFVRQQGFRNASLAGCEFSYPALMWQPRVIGAVVVIGLILQAWPVFLALSAILWWNVTLPALNPFDALYNRLIASPRRSTPLTPAPAPRRFAQGMAASFMLGIAATLYFGWYAAAYVLEGLLVIALASLIFGGFCLGSYIFHLLNGEARFANRTLPWAKPD